MEAPVRPGRSTSRISRAPRSGCCSRSFSCCSSSARAGSTGSAQPRSGSSSGSAVPGWSRWSTARKARAWHQALGLARTDAPDSAAGRLDGAAVTRHPYRRRQRGAL